VQKLSELAINRNNNFNLIRFISAFLVLYSHSYPLTGSHSDPLERYGVSFGDLAVNIFFVTSGFLVAGSLATRKNIGIFLYARILRIMPGLTASMLFCVFVVGVLYTEKSLFAYFSSPATYDYLFSNTTLVVKALQWGLPGVFIDNPYKITVNGSIWTLPWELKMYLLLTVVSLPVYLPPQFRLHEKWLTLAVSALGVVSILVYLVLIMKNQHLEHPGIRFLGMFFIGATFYVMRHRIPISHGIALLMALMLFYLRGNPFVFKLFLTVSIGYLCIYLAYTTCPILLRFNRIGDYSYGIYIYAFPVQQAISASYPGIDVSEMTVLAMLVTLPLSIASWHFIEKPFLDVKKRHEEIGTWINHYLKKRT